MKKGIHPPYQEVVFQDSSTGAQYLVGSTIKTSNKTCEINGKTYPLVTVDISAASHPFFTGKQKIMDVAGRVEKFQRKYNLGKTAAQKAADIADAAMDAAAADAAAEKKAQG